MAERLAVQIPLLFPLSLRPWARHFTLMELLHGSSRPQSVCVSEWRGEGEATGKGFGVQLLESTIQVNLLPACPSEGSDVHTPCFLFFNHFWSYQVI